MKTILELEADNREWLKTQCNRYVNGICSTRRCLVRGGHESGSGPVDFDVATCEHHELINQLDRLTGALGKIASWSEGPAVNSSFDEPASAAIARAALSC